MVISKKQRVNREIREESRGCYDEANKLREVRKKEKIHYQIDKTLKNKVATILSQFKSAELRRLKANDNYDDCVGKVGWCTERHTFHEEQIYCTDLHHNSCYRDYLTPHCTDSFGLPCYYGADCWFTHMPTKEQVEAAIRSNGAITTYDTYIAYLQKESANKRATSSNESVHNSKTPTVERRSVLPHQALPSAQVNLGQKRSLDQASSTLASTTSNTDRYPPLVFSSFSGTNTDAEGGWTSSNAFRTTDPRSFGINYDNTDFLIPREASKKTDAAVTTEQLSTCSRSSTLLHPTATIPDWHWSDSPQPDLSAEADCELIIIDHDPPTATSTTATNVVWRPFISSLSWSATGGLANDRTIGKRSFGILDNHIESLLPKEGSKKAASAGDGSSLLHQPSSSTTAAPSVSQSAEVMSPAPACCTAPPVSQPLPLVPARRFGVMMTSGPSHSSTDTDTGGWNSSADGATDTSTSGIQYNPIECLFPWEVSRKTDATPAIGKISSSGHSSSTFLNQPTSTFAETSAALHPETRTLPPTRPSIPPVVRPLPAAPPRRLAVMRSSGPSLSSWPDHPSPPAVAMTTWVSSPSTPAPQPSSANRAKTARASKPPPPPPQAGTRQSLRLTALQIARVEEEKAQPLIPIVPATVPAPNPASVKPTGKITDFFRADPYSATAAPNVTTTAPTATTTTVSRAVGKKGDNKKKRKRRPWNGRYLYDNDDVRDYDTGNKGGGRGGQNYDDFDTRSERRHNYDRDYDDWNEHDGYFNY